MCVFDVLFEKDCCATLCVINVCYGFEARYVQLVIVHLLEKHDIQIHCAYKTLQGVYFSSVSDVIDIDCCKVIRDEDD